MPPPNPARGTPQEWLARANGKLALARQPLPADAYWEDLCFLAQQAAELAIKAIYQQHGWAFDYVHELGHLLDELAKLGLSVPANVQDADKLTIFAAQTRYPGMAPVTEARYRESVRIAEAVVAWAITLVPAQTSD